MVCGIYKIENKIDKKVYVGSSKIIDKRLEKHKNDLKNNVHGNEHLQKAVNKYGLENFDFVIIQPYLESELIEKENHWINEYNSLNRKYGYNMQNADRTILTKRAKQKQLKAMRTNEHRQLKSELRQKAWDSHPEIKEKYSKLFTVKFNNHESPNRNNCFDKWRGSTKQKETMKIKMKERWNDPNEREKMIAIRIKNGQKKEFKEKISKISIARWADPEFQKTMSKKHTLKWADPNYKEKMKESKKANLLIPIKCKICEKLFVRNVHNQTVCSKECKHKDKNKKRNNKIFIK